MRLIEVCAIQKMQIGIHSYYIRIAFVKCMRGKTAKTAQLSALAQSVRGKQAVGSAATAGVG